MKMLYRWSKSNDREEPWLASELKVFEILIDWRQFFIGASWHDSVVTLQLGFISVVYWWDK